MVTPRHVAILLAGFSLAANNAASGAESAPKKAVPASKSSQPDIQFLEYLGTLEGDDENWTDVGEAAAAQESAVKDSKVSAKAGAAKPVERK